MMKTSKTVDADADKTNPPACDRLESRQGLDTRTPSAIAQRRHFNVRLEERQHVDLNQATQLMGSIFKIEPIEDFSALHGGFEETLERDDLALVVSSSPLVG
jgi:hypothetical protein